MLSAGKGASAAPSTPKMRRVLATLQCLAAASAFSATTAPSGIPGAAFAEWLVPLCPGLDGSRATLADDSTITAARAYNADQVIYSIGNDALLSPVAAYADKDAGPPLRDIALQAGPGFGVVVVAGLLAAEKIRGFRSRRGQGDAPQLLVLLYRAAGARCYACFGTTVSVEADEQLVDQAVALLLPILENDGAASVDRARSRGGESRRFCLKNGRGRPCTRTAARGRGAAGSSRTSRAAPSASPSRRSGRRSPATPGESRARPCGLNFRAEAGEMLSPQRSCPRASRATAMQTQRFGRSRGACPRATSRRRRRAAIAA